MPKPTRRWVLAAGLLLAAAPAARAQPSPELTMEIYNSNISAITTSIINKDMMDKTMRRYNAKNGSRSTTTKSPATTAAKTSFAYVPTPALKRQTVQGYVDRLKTKNPAASQAVAQQLGPGKNDYGQIYRGIIQGTGLRDNDAADAMAAFTVLGWMIVNDVREAKDLPAGSARGVRAQFAPKLAANEKLAAPGVPAQLGEEMKLLLVVTQAGWQSALKQNTLADYRQGVAAMFKNQYGLDMSALKLTPQGFAKK